MKNVSKLELKNSILESLEYNSYALDYISNEMSRFDNLLKYNSEDNEVRSIYNTLKYIDFSLKYLEKSYNDSLKKIGVIV